MKVGRAALRPLNFSIARRVGGQRVYVPVLGGLKVGLSGEPFLSEMLNVVLAETKGAVVDVGMNLGQTLVKVKAADPERRYLGFEVNPACFFYVERLVRQNRWRNVSVFPFGLSNEPSVQELRFSGGNAVDSRASLLREIRPDSDSLQTKHVALFDYAAVEQIAGETVALVKIDVEGTDLEVLQGMVGMIERDKPVLITEIFPALQHGSPVPWLAARQDALMSILASYDYRLYRIRETARGGFLRLQSIQKLTMESGSSEFNYLAVPKPMRALIAKFGSARVEA